MDSYDAILAPYDMPEADAAVWMKANKAIIENHLEGDVGSGGRVTREADVCGV